MVEIKKNLKALHGVPYQSSREASQTNILTCISSEKDGLNFQIKIKLIIFVLKAFSTSISNLIIIFKIYA